MFFRFFLRFFFRFNFATGFRFDQLHFGGSYQVLPSFTEFFCFVESIFFLLRWTIETRFLSLVLFCRISTGFLLLLLLLLFFFYFVSFLVVVLLLQLSDDGGGREKLKTPPG